MANLKSNVSTAPCFLHGVMMNILNCGVLITGASGSGKSELALTLIQRGHQLVADDVVECCLHEGQVMTRAPLALQNLLELRGLGIYNICQLFGEQAIRKEQVLFCMIHLMQTDPIERTTHLNIQYESVCDVLIPKASLPFTTPRSFDVLVEFIVRHLVGR